MPESPAGGAPLSKQAQQSNTRGIRLGREAGFAAPPDDNLGDWRIDSARTLAESVNLESHHEAGTPVYKASPARQRGVVTNCLFPNPSARALSKAARTAELTTDLKSSLVKSRGPLSDGSAVSENYHSVKALYDYFEEAMS